MDEIIERLRKGRSLYKESIQDGMMWAENIASYGELLAVTRIYNDPASFAEFVQKPRMLNDWVGGVPCPDAAAGFLEGAARFFDEWNARAS